MELVSHAKINAAIRKPKSAKYKDLKIFVSELISSGI